MTKAFIVRFKEDDEFCFNNFTSQSGCASYPPFNQKKRDKGPIMVISKDIADVATKYPTAVDIQEFDVVDVVISDKVDYLLEKRK